MMNRVSLCFSVLFVLVFSAVATFAQQPERPRIVPNAASAESQPINQPPPNRTTQRRPILTNQIIIHDSPALVKKTASSQPLNRVSPVNPVNAYTQSFNQKLFKAIQTRLGVPYRYGSSGPTTFDCSGLVWSVFGDAGYAFERSSAKTLWQNSAPVEGDDRYKFGTLVFFNRLGHIGIVYDDTGFYHASSSQGVTFSKFDGYWAKRIVGYRRLSISRDSL